MKKIALLAVAIAAAAPVASYAQDASGTDTSTEAKAPDGSKAFGIEPYVGVMGGYDSYDKSSEFGSANGGKMDGALIQGVAGVNVPIGPAFVGVEGNAAKGFGDISWEYGVKGRVGARAGDSGMVYATAGYEWVNGKASHGYGDKSDWIYGVGAEVGPKDIGLGGITGNAGVRLRFEVDTYDFDSLRPMAGVIFHF
ncbi:outer membrane protein [Novosphingobium sp. 9]|uniref:outer membrane protein n=1 Tax=Novosphingobium sp. 9 TaxID=2025349 RepID=UPI0021B65F43|nr:opacity protein [Novosphingobium sp. 9]